MPRLRNMLGETGTIEIPVSNDEPLAVVYRRGVMTARLQMKMLTTQAALQGSDLKAAVAGDALRGLCEMASALIDSWNLTDDAGQVVGTDTESLLDVDLSILTEVIQEIGRAIAPDPLREGGSNNGLSAVASSEPPRTISES